MNSTVNFTTQEYGTKEESVEISSLVSNEMRRLFEIVVFVMGIGCICLFGIFSNIINILIFYEHGLNDTVNIGLFALAIADLCTLITTAWISICLNPLLEQSGIPWDLGRIVYHTGAWPHVCFGRICLWITTYITAERCLCIALPMRVKQIITPRRTTIIMFIIFIMNFLTASPIYIGSYLDWRFFPDKNKSLITLVFKDNGEELDGIGLVLFAVSGTLPLPPVVIMTIILVARLKHQSQWRMRSSGGSKQHDLTSKRDQKTMNMVVMVAGILIGCYTPGVVLSAASYLVPGFNFSGINFNLFYVAWCFADLLQALNSSINIFVYYKMSSKYRQSLLNKFKACVKNDI